MECPFFKCKTISNKTEVFSEPEYDKVKKFYDFQK